MSGTTYNFTLLNVPGEIVDTAFGISNSGTIAGGVVFTDERLPNGDDQSSAFVGTPDNLSTFSYPGSDYTAAYGINNSGTIIGQYRDNSVPGNVFHGFFLVDGNFTSFDVLPAATSTFPQAIDDNGDTAGGFRSADGDIHGYIEIGGTVSTVDLGDDSFTSVNAINDSGDYAGSFHSAEGFQGFEVINGTTTVISVPNSSYTVVWGMNDDGAVVGDSMGDGRHGFLYQDGTYTTIDYPGVASGSFARAINDSGQIVGSSGQDHGFLATPPCFALGTNIATSTGFVAVEHIVAGDLVVSAFGGTVPVIWVGHRHVDCRHHPRPEEVWPIRVRADAFAGGQPARDVLLSPEHSVFIDGVLIPIRHLVNDISIFQEAVGQVTYFHVELPSHDVILADGLPVESYLDIGNRGAFANGGPILDLHPDFAQQTWEAQACAPQLDDGPIYATVVARLHSRATARVEAQPQRVAI